MARKILIGGFAALVALGLMGTPASAAGPDASASASCSIKGKYPPASYVTSIKTSRVGCAKAKKVVKAYHKCRRTKAGKCKSRVQGFKCTEGRRSTVPGVQYSTKVTCKKGSRKIVSSYTQNL